jgi:hypothetical protein
MGAPARGEGPSKLRAGLPRVQIDRFLRAESAPTLGITTLDPAAPPHPWYRKQPKGRLKFLSFGGFLPQAPRSARGSWEIKKNRPFRLLCGSRAVSARRYLDDVVPDGTAHRHHPCRQRQRVPAAGAARPSWSTARCTTKGQFLDSPRSSVPSSGNSRPPTWPTRFVTCRRPRWRRSARWSAELPDERPHDTADGPDQRRCRGRR